MHLGWQVTLEEAEVILGEMVSDRLLMLVPSNGEGVPRYTRCT